MDTGQLLVVRGDLTALQCDAVLVPTSADLQVTSAWTSVVPVHRQDRASGWFDVALERDRDWGKTDRCLRAPDRDGQQVWLVRTDGWGQAGEHVAESIEQAVRRLRPGLSSRRRALPLVGLPLAGTGDGGYADRRGDVVQALVPVLERVAREVGVDLALVLRDEQDMTAVQSIRTVTGVLAPDERAAAEVLGGLAAAGRLVLFLGAGISVAAGLPSWKELLLQLQERAPALHDLDLAGLDPRDAAQLAYDALDRDDFVEYIRRTFTTSRHALAHALVAGLGVEATVTTNYDNAYELAHQGLGDGHQLRVLPQERAVPGEPWLLKLHGDALDPASIVLTRSQYVAHGDAAAPLSGLVQALLMTRHMLFVGFSLTDDNFARLAHQVRRVMGPNAAKVGTVLSLEPDRARDLLWQEDLDFVTLGDEGQVLQAARRLELFLDHVSWAATRARGGRERYLLDPRYAALASVEDVELRNGLRELHDRLPAAVRKSEAWRVVEVALRRLGQR